MLIVTCIKPLIITLVTLNVTFDRKQGITCYHLIHAQTLKSIYRSCVGSFLGFIQKQNLNIFLPISNPDHCPICMDIVVANLWMLKSLPMTGDVTL